MIGALFSLPIWLFQQIHHLFLYLSQWLLFWSFFLSVAYRCGWIHRLLWHVLEYEASKALNYTPVTFGYVKFDLWRGRLWASNAIIHAPQRDGWKWQSPVLARVGQVYIEANTLHCLFRLLFMGEPNHPVEIFTCQLSDIQVFVERRQHVYNFYLLDPHNVVPDPVADFVDEAPILATNPPSPAVSQQLSHQNVDVPVIRDENTMTTMTAHTLTHHASDGPTGPDDEQEAAQRMVDEMMKAVQSIGRAARRGSLHETLLEQRHSITTQLKKLKTKKKSEAMQEGVKIVQQVSKAVVEKTQRSTYNATIGRRKRMAGEKIIRVRVGRVVLNDLRIFTHDNWDGPDNDNDEHDDGGETDVDQETKSAATTTAAPPPPRSSSSSWNRPMVLAHTALRPAEFCPPVSAKDDNGLPALYMPIDKAIDVVLKRVLTDVAKSNTGRLLQTAFGEVLDFWVDQDGGGGGSGGNAAMAASNDSL